MAPLGIVWWGATSQAMPDAQLLRCQTMVFGVLCPFRSLTKRAATVTCQGDVTDMTDVLMSSRFEAISTLAKWAAASIPTPPPVRRFWEQVPY